MSDLMTRLRSGDASWELREKAADALEAKDKRIAELEAALADLLTYPDAELSRKAAENVLAKPEKGDE